MTSTDHGTLSKGEYSHSLYAGFLKKYILTLCVAFNLASGGILP
jgi:hypothetical protein